MLAPHERAGLVGALDCVDAVVLFGEDTPLELLEVVRPDILAKGRPSDEERRRFRAPLRRPRPRRLGVRARGG